MKRRDFVALGGALLASPLTARAQKSAMPVVGLINGGSADASVRNAAAFRNGLTETDYVEGQNVMVEYNWLEGHYDRLPALVTDLVRRQVAVIATPATLQAALAAKAATATIPIVFGVAQEPGSAWSCRQPGPTRQECDRHQFFRPGGDGQAAAAAA
jgi:putative tryptophan/tyrosine transport system substrate-binding protein